MTLELALFLILAAIAVAAAVAMLLSANAIYSALFLIMNFAVVSVFYLILNAPFIAMVQVTVYAGAIMVLFLFVIMLLGAERLGAPQGQGALSWQRPVAIVLGAALMGVTIFALASQGAGPTPDALQPQVIEAFGSPLEIGKQLFSAYLFPFEVTSFLLLVAMIGAIVLTKEEKTKLQRRSPRQ